MKKAAVILLISVIALLVSAGAAEAAIPQLITVQGRLRNATTLSPMQGTNDINFSIYNVSSGGTSLYSENHSVTTDQFGIFQVLLGSITTLDLPFDRQYFLEVEVENSVLSPRHSMTSSAYTYRANVSTDVECTSCINAGEIANNAVTRGTILNDAVNLAKQQCYEINHLDNTSDQYVWVEGICDDNDGCFIRYYYDSGIYVGNAAPSWGYYHEVAGGLYIFSGIENSTTLVTRTGDNRDSDVTNELIVESTNNCELRDSVTGENRQWYSVGTKGAVPTNGRCYGWICD